MGERAVGVPWVARLFGGPEFVGPAGRTTLSGAKQRAIAGRLAVDAGRVVPFDRLVDDVWGDAPPDTVRASMQVHVSQIRRALAAVGLADAVETAAGGYRLTLHPQTVDLLAFEAVSAAPAGDDDSTLDLIVSALAWSNGPLLPGAVSAPFVAAVETRVESERVRMAQIATEAAVRSRRVATALAAIEPLLGARPYEEPLWLCAAQLLAEQGRQAEALDRLATVRRALHDDLGLDPSPLLVDLEGRILRQELAGAAPGAPTAERRPSGAVSAGASLPAPRRLVGRDGLVQAVRRSVRPGGVVTLVGPGGIGKTSLAIAAAGALAEEFRDGVCFVDLAALPTGHDALAALVAALGVSPAQGEDQLAQVLEVLADRQQLLLFDNCEHVVSSVAALVDRVLRCRGISVVATSREPLGSDSEQIIDVPPLGGDDAAELFVLRAQSALLDFVPDDDEVTAIRQIVELVDGMPLGLELASSMIRVLSTTEIAHELATGTRLTSQRRGSSRHASMDQAVRWSYDLLDDRSRLVFEILSVVAGTVDLDGAHVLCGASGVDSERSELLAVLADLVNRSLLTATRTPGGMRYRMLVPVRSVARSMLRERGMQEPVAVAHADLVVRRLRESTPVVEGDDARRGFALLAEVAPEVRAAYDWCVQHEPARAVTILASISPLAFSQVTQLPELRDWLRSALASDDVDAATRLALLLTAALSLDEDSERMIAWCREAVDLARSVTDRRSEVIAASGLAYRIGERDNDASISVLERALVDARSIESGVLEGLALHFLSNHLLRAGRHDEVATLIDQALTGPVSRFGMYSTLVLYQRARAALESGDHAAAERFYRAVDEESRRTALPHAHAYALFGLGRLHLERGEDSDALARFQEAADADRITSPHELWADHMMAGIAAARLGDRETLAALLRAMPTADRALAHGAVELLRGLDVALASDASTARRHFLDAVRRFGTVGVGTMAAQVLTEWARSEDDEDISSWLTSLAVGLRRGDISTASAVAAVTERLGT